MLPSSLPTPVPSYKYKCLVPVDNNYKGDPIPKHVFCEAKYKCEFQISFDDVKPSY